MSDLPDFSYDREAVVVASGMQIPVHAKLQKRFRQPLGEEWSGTLTPLDPNESFWAVHDADVAVLRTDLGREATFRPGNFTHVHGKIAHMPIEGNGRAPF